MKAIMFFLISFGISVTCLAQGETDSLKHLLHKALVSADTPNVAYYNSYLGYHFNYNEKKFDSAIHYYRGALKTNIKQSNLPLFASTVNGIGASYGEIGFPDSAINYYNEALLAFTQLQDSAQALEVQANLIITYKDLGLYEKALTNAFDLLKTLEKLPPDRRLASCYSTIAFVYEKTGDFESTLEYHRKALDIRKKIGSRKGEGLSYNSIGETFQAVGQYDSALKNLFRSFEIKNALGDKNGSSSTLNNLGEVMIDIRQYQEAEKYLMQSLAVKRDFNDRADMAVTLNNLAKVKYDQGKLDEAEIYLNEAEKLARQTKALEHLREILQLNIKIQKEKGNAKKALSLSDELLVIRDSLLNVEKARNIRSVAFEYESEKKVQQILLLEAKNKIADTQLESKLWQLRATIAGLVLLFILAIVILQHARTVRKNKLRVDTLLRELHHRVKNNLQMLSSILSLQANQLKDADAIEAVKSYESRLNAMALIHKKLYKDDQERNINIKDYITELIQYLVFTYGYNDKGVKLELKIEDLQVDVDKAIPLGLVLNELISNAFKHAYIDSADAHLRVTLQRQTNSDIQIQVADNGIGMTKSVKKGEDTKFGIRLINSLIKELRGSYEVHSDSGTKYTLNIPLA